MADRRPYSSIVVDGVEQAPSRAMLRPVGFETEDFDKPQIGIASTWSMVTPCNMHIDALAEAAAMGADEAGAKSVVFNTITVSDGISMGTPGMRYSLVSREVIADSIETVVGAQGFDGFVTIGGCDKNMPACAMAMARLDRPSVFVYGGTILPGAERRDIISVFEAVGAHAAGKIGDVELLEVEKTAIPGPGSCGGMYTANTMALRHRGPGPVPAQLVRPERREREQAPGQLPRRRRRRPPDRTRHQALGHPVPRVLRERHHRLHRPRGLDQRRAAPAGDRERRGHPTRTRRLHAHRRPGPGARRHASGRPVRHVRADRDRRHPTRS